MTSAVDLNTRFGGGDRNPSETQLKEAIREVFHEDHPDLIEGDYLEHPNAWLSYGSQSGDKWTVYTLDLYRNGSMMFSKLADQDDLEPEFERTKAHLTEDEALRLWRLLASGDLNALLKEDWR
jgi:hypothetical protein